MAVRLPLSLPACRTSQAFPALLLCLLLCALWTAPALGQQPPAPRQLRGLVVLVRFPGLATDETRERVELRFGVHLDRYVREMSGNSAALSVDVTPGWTTLPQPVEAYRISPRNIEVDKGRVMRLIDDSLAGLGPEVDLERYDFVALALGAKMSEYGMVGLCGYPGMLGWASEDVFRTRGGRRVRGGVAIFTSQAHLGTLFHDVAHVLGGVREGKRRVPCLYDHDLQGRPGPVMEVFAGSIVNMGYWDPMSCHFHQRELPPPGVSAWTRLRLGWLDEAKVRELRPGDTAEVLLDALNDPAAQTAAIRIRLSPTRYYLIENRQPRGFDKNLPGSGVLVMLADDSIGECRRGQAPVKLVDADPSRPRLTGAAFDLGRRELFEDAAANLRIRVLEAPGEARLVRVEPVAHRSPAPN